MPEGDTLVWTARRLNAALEGAVITRSDLRTPRLATVDLSGRSALPAITYGKHLLQRFSGGVTLHSHLKMEGRWLTVQAPGTADAGRASAKRLATDVRTIETAHTTRALLYTREVLAAGLKLGTLELLPTTGEHRTIGHLGPDLLAPSWHEAGWVEALRRLRTQPKRPLGEALLDQRNVAGLGTFWISEMLFVHRILPWRPVDEISDSTLDTVLDDTRRLMLRSGETGIQSSTGARAGQIKRVHARSGLPCLVCHDTLRVAMAGPRGQERTLFSCPTCQGGYAPGDDRAPQRPLVERRPTPRP